MIYLVRSSFQGKKDKLDAEDGNNISGAKLNGDTFERSGMSLSPLVVERSVEEIHGREAREGRGS